MRDITYSSSAGLLTMVKATYPPNHKKLNKPTSYIYYTNVQKLWIKPDMYNDRRYKACEKIISTATFND